MDPVGAVASIVQLVVFGSHLVSRLRDFHEDLNEKTKLFVDIIIELPLLLDILDKTKDAISANRIDTETQKALQPVLDACRSNIEQLNNIAEKIIPSQKDSWFKKSSKAVSSLSRERNVNKLKSSLRDHIQTLTFYHTAAASRLQPSKNKELVKIREWLSAPDPSTRLRNELKKKEEGTGSWFLQRQEYTTWLTEPASSLWLCGIPGCGKTVLSSTIIESLQQTCEKDTGKALAYFYFDFGDHERQLARAMVKSLVDQFSQQCARIPPTLDSLYSYMFTSGRQEPALESLLTVLREVAEDLPVSYIVLDALDESVDRAELLEILEQITSWKLKGLHVLVTSRLERDIEVSLRKIVLDGNIIFMESDVVDPDIRRFIHMTLSNDSKLDKWTKYPDLQNEIETRLMSGVHGMFKWAACQIDSLRACRTKSSLREALNSLPSTLDETYERILCSIRGDDITYAIRILQWLTFSVRPLTMEEVAEIIAIDTEREPAFEPESILEDPREVLDICSSLITIIEERPKKPDHSHYDSDYGSTYSSNYGSDDEDEDDPEAVVRTVRLAHSSVKEYLTSTRIRQSRIAKFGIEAGKCHGFIVGSCLGYLLQFDSDKDLTQDDLASFKLSLYSAKHWTTHAQEAKWNPNLLRLCLQLFAKDSKTFQNWIQISELGSSESLSRTRRRKRGRRRSSFSKSSTPAHTPLYYLSQNGLDEAVRAFLESEPVDPNVHEGRFNDPLQVASAKGHEKVVQILLEKGADTHGAYALWAAASEGHTNVVQLLLDSGIDVNERDARYGYPLRAAAAGGHESVVEMLLDRAADPNALDGSHGNALWNASNGGHEKIVQLLLRKGANVNARAEKGSSALEAALSRNQAKVVEVLLSNGADLLADSSSLVKALRKALDRGQQNIFELLLDRVPDSDIQNAEYENALYEASEQGFDRIARALLRRGVDANARGKLDGRWGSKEPEESYTLYAASYKGRKEIVHLLLDKDAKVNLQLGKYGTPLQAASLQGHRAIVELLVARGADINATGGQCGCALGAASFRGHSDIVELLIIKGADINAQGGMYGNALQAASIRGHRAIVHRLLEEGANVNAEGGLYGNALQAASVKGYTRIFARLLDEGADVNAQGGKYGTALQAASAKEYFDDTSMDADDRARGTRYLSDGSMTKYYRTIDQRYQKIIETLLSKGADVNIRGGKYGTALIAAVHREQETAVELLLNNGADVNIQVEKHGDALTVAASQRRGKDILEALLKNGADMNAPSGENGDALYVASEAGSKAVVELLLEKGADGNKHSGKLGSPLHAAAMTGHEEIVKLLVSKGARVDPEDLNKALLSAAAKDLAKTKALVAAGADINPRCVAGCSILHHAAKSGQTDTVEWILEQGVQVDLVDSALRSPLHVAILRNNNAVADLLLQSKASASLQDIVGDTPLQLAMRSRNNLMISLFDTADNLDSQPTAHERRHHLSQSVKSLASRILSNSEKHTTLLYSNLGRCLVFLDQLVEATTAFEQQIRVPDRQSRFIHDGVFCDKCQRSPLDNTRYVCRTCPDVDLCETCEFEYHYEGGWLQTCRYHSFLRVPGEDWNGEKANSVNALGETKTQWLERIRDLQRTK